MGPLAASRFDVRAQLAAFAPFLNPHYLPVRSAKTRSHFCDAEDDLLGLGLERYGMENLNVVRAMLMPCKSVTQLEHRVTNMTRRAKPDNPIKRAKERLESEGMLSIAVAETVFWVLSFPTSELLYFVSTGEWIDLLTQEGQIKFLAFTAGWGALGGAIAQYRTVLTAAAMTPWMDT